MRTVTLSVPPNISRADTLARRTPDFEGLADDRILIEIWDRAGRSVYKSLGGIDLARFPDGIRTIERDEYHWRVLGIQEDDRFIQVAQHVSVREDLALRLALRTLWPLGLFFPATILIVLVVVGRGGTSCLRGT